MSSDAGVGFNDRLLKYVDAQHQETSRKLLVDSTYSGAKWVATNPKVPPLKIDTADENNPEK